MDGIDGALKVDKTDAAIKAASQKKILDNQLKEGGASGLDEKSAEKIAAAIEKIAKTSGTKAGAQLKSDMSAISAAGGDKEYKDLMADSAVERTSTLKTSLRTKQSSGFLDENGALTSSGQLAMTIDTLSKVMPMMNRAGLFNDPQARENAVRAMAKSKLGKNAPEDKIQEFLKNEGWDNVANMSAEEFAKDIFGRQGALFASHAQIAGKDGTMYTLAFGKGGASAKSQSGFSGVNDNSIINKDGRRNDGQVRDMVHNGVSGFLQALGVSGEVADDIANGVISAWDGGKEVIGGIGVVGAGAGYAYKVNKKEINHLLKMNQI